MPPKQLLHPRYWPNWIGVGLLVATTYLPYSLQMAIGKTLGLILHKVARSRRHIAEVNMDLCFPEKSAAERAALVRQIFIDNGKGMMETLIGWFRAPDHLASRTRFHGFDKLRKAQEEGKGVLLLGAHYSMLDLAGALFITQLPANISYRPQDNPVMNWLMERRRARLYIDCFTRKDIRGFIRCLKKGQILWYAQDQDFGRKNSIFVDFFGIPTATITATSRIAKAGQAYVMPMTYFRAEDNSYDVTIHDPLPIPSGDEVADAELANKFIEDQLRQHPSQYLWLHRRFKTRPEKGESFYKKK